MDVVGGKAAAVSEAVGIVGVEVGAGMGASGAFGSASGGSRTAMEVAMGIFGDWRGVSPDGEEDPEIVLRASAASSRALSFGEKGTRVKGAVGATGDPTATQ